MDWIRDSGMSRTADEGDDQIIGGLTLGAYSQSSRTQVRGGIPWGSELELILILIFASGVARLFSLHS